MAMHGVHCLGRHRGAAHGHGRPAAVAVGCRLLVAGCWFLDNAQVAIMATTMAMMDIAHYTNITAENVIDI